MSIASEFSSDQLVLVGVGPGDPELLTVAAVRVLKAADVVAYPIAHEGAEGMALAIASRWIRSDQRLLPLSFPMVTESQPRIAAWRQAADVLAAEVRSGNRVVLLCEGDVSLFATGSYVQLALRRHHPDVPFALIPGIPSVCAAAAAAVEGSLDLPLAFQQEGLLIRPCPETNVELIALLQSARKTSTVLGLIKLGQRWSWVRPALEQEKLLDRALFAQRVGWPDQWVAPAQAVPDDVKPYFSLLLIRQQWPEVLP
ncbi:precorrin-2 C(20)-methyltransferase [Synechococcus sp. MIT S9509]|uniref:precorrin-2 C(20)-methyltransferase n=1 Tax=Synechococcus sp. MIT S9509 TaxID=1801630 RepID=UPI001E3D6EF2|nr:precorrin-2 C(20)-methyltransferase [Synechococcus sp. MIT S9509]